MIELIRHIEILLLDNDCVVIPGFGGFIAHYTPAVWNTNEGLFLPPSRTIGFNAQLKMNDGVLTQSYMEVYGTDFSDATRILQREVENFIDVLHKNGKIELKNLGEISTSVYGSYVFSPYENTILSPFLYGLDTLDIKELSNIDPNPIVIHTNSPAPRKNYEIRINRSFVRNAVAAVAAVLLFFYMSSPIENTYVEKINYAQLLPADLFGKIEGQSVLTASIGSERRGSLDFQNQKGVTQIPVTAREVKVPKKTDEETNIKKNEAALTNVSAKRYYIIIGSVKYKDDAETTVTDLKSNGFSDACVLTGGGRVRISLKSYLSRKEADKELIELRKNNTYKDAWLLTK